MRIMWAVAKFQDRVREQKVVDYDPLTDMVTLKSYFGKRTYSRSASNPKPSREMGQDDMTMFFEKKRHAINAMLDRAERRIKEAALEIEKAKKRLATQKRALERAVAYAKKELES